MLTALVMRTRQQMIGEGQSSKEAQAVFEVGASTAGATAGVVAVFIQLGGGMAGWKVPAVRVDAKAPAKLRDSVCGLWSFLLFTCLPLPCGSPSCFPLRQLGSPMYRSLAFCRGRDAAKESGQCCFGLQWHGKGAPPHSWGGTLEEEPACS